MKLLLLSYFIALVVAQRSPGDCLSSINGLVVLTPSNASFAEASQPYNLRISPKPSFITFPTSVPQTQAIVRCASLFHLRISAKSGGHSYAAYGLSGNIVIDLGGLRALTVNSDGTATTQTGNTLGDLATGIFSQGGRALPHGSCPYIGTGGHTLYGGYGFVSRLGGLLLDRVISAQVVLADGRLVTASKTANADLFWAIRGGGPSFGLVTAWVFNTFPAPPTVIHYVINIGTHPAPEIISAYSIWQSFVADAPNEFSSSAFFEASSTFGSLFMSFSGDYYGTEDAFQAVVQPLMVQLPATARLTTTALDWIGGLEASAGDNGTLSTAHPDGTDTFFAKSLVTTDPVSNASLTSWINYMATAGSSSDTSWFVIADLWGGAISSIPAGATAFAHRDAFLVYQFYASSSNKQPPYPEDGIPFLNGMVNAIEPRPQGAYPNYIDPTLTTEQWKRQYFGNHIGRLQRIKSAVDPTNVFGFDEGFSP
ncbi:hypothetical protein BU17DRAFT_53046 [Hysterangium stoloniferum]|nr:hypothetical protein BU17DRAFT_53046 [Hysterangium stoloniferum]